MKIYLIAERAIQVANYWSLQSINIDGKTKTKKSDEPIVDRYISFLKSIKGNKVYVDEIPLDIDDPVDNYNRILVFTSMDKAYSEFNFKYGEKYKHETIYLDELFLYNLQLKQKEKVDKLKQKQKIEKKMKKETELIKKNLSMANICIPNGEEMIYIGDMLL